MKKAKRITALLISCAMLLALLAGCSGTKSRGEDNNDNNTQAEEGYPFTLDNYGRQVEITKRPQKVLTLGPNCTELFAALGLSDLVVGRSLVNHSRGPLPEYADAVNAIPELNHASATREAIISYTRSTGR